jgi:DNA mismatch repair protein MutH
MYLKKTPPANEVELLKRCTGIEGLTFLQLASAYSIAIPDHPVQRKGWVGKLIEDALGATAGALSLPDFNHLGIELKTIPVNQSGNPAESTFITTIPLLTVHKQKWETSQCYQKLKRVLWVPVEGDKNIPFYHRRIGQCILWSPNQEETASLCRDWHELTLMIRLGRLDEINSTYGEFLQIRPKGANAKSLCYATDEQGRRIQTLPRGFYLRPSFTKKIILNSAVEFRLNAPS